MTKKQKGTRRSALYVDNDDLYESFVAYRSRADVQEFLETKRIHYAARDKARRDGVPYHSDFDIGDAPPLPKFVAEAIFKIATNYSRRANWHHQSHCIDDMIGDAIVFCLRYGHNFNPEKSRSAYGYITQMVHNSFLQRINVERDQGDVRREMVAAAYAGQVRSVSGTEHFVTTSIEHSMKAIDDQNRLDAETGTGRHKSRRRGKKKKGPTLDEDLF